MKKITFLFFVLSLCFCSVSYGQYLSEGFESGVPPAGWTLNDTNPAFSWGTNNFNPHGGLYSAQVTYDPDLVPQNEDLITPVLDLTSATNPRLIFWFNMSYYWGVDPENNYDFNVGITDGTTTTPLWSETELGVFVNWEWNEVIIDLTAYAGTNNMQIVFNYTGIDGAALDIDDVLINEAPTCTTAVVDSSTVVDDCNVLEFSVEVVVSTVGDGTFITDGIGGSFPIVAGTVTAGPYTGGDNVTLSIVHSDSDCDFVLGSFQTGCTLPGAVCGNPLIVGALPYLTTDNTSNYGNDYENADVPSLAGAQYTMGTGSPYYITGDDVVYAFTPDNNGSFNFDLTNTLDDWIGFWLFEGCPFTSVVAYHTATSGTTRSLPNITLSGGTTYYVVISTWAAPQSTPYTLNIRENTCTAVTVAYEVVNDCDVSGGFLIDVDVTDMGSATGITVMDDQGNASQALTAVGTLQFGPYTLGTNVVITINDDNDVNCTIISSAMTQATCPPDCATTPFPADGAVDIPVGNITFTWEAPTSGPAPTSYNLYAGETPSGDDYGLIGNYPGTSAAITLNGFNIQLYWIVKPVNGTVEASGCPVWTFTTESAPGYCLSAEYGQYPSGTYTPTTCNGTTENVITTIAWASEFSVVAVTAGVTYQFNSSVPTDLITISADGGSTAAAYGITPVTWTAPTTGVVNFYIHADDQCTSQSVSRVRSVYCGGDLSVGSFDLNSTFTYYPNPVTSTLTLSGVKTIEQVTVYNMLGQKVLSLSPNAVSSELDMSHLNAGAYFVKVLSNKAEKTIKVIKK